jgi:hypothetical protein
MTIGEQLYLGLVLLAFFTFGVTLVVVSSRTNSHMRQKAAADRAPSVLRKAA